MAVWKRNDTAPTASVGDEITEELQLFTRGCQVVGLGTTSEKLNNEEKQRLGARSGVAF